MLKKLGGFFLDILEVVVFAIAIFLFVYLLLLQPHKIKGQSMEPNFSDGEYLLTEKVSYRFNEPERGDVVVFKAPGTGGEEFIKRIIGLPGEEISLIDRKIHINARALDEEYLGVGEITNPGTFLDNGEIIRIPAEHYFVMGDNRSASSDSRTWGFITTEEITGRAWVTYWPLDKFGVIENISYSL